MKYENIILAIATATCVVGVSFATSNGTAGKDNKLTPGDATQVFNNTAPTINSGWNTSPDTSTVQNRYYFDNDISSYNTFTAASATTAKLVELEIAAEVAPVPGVGALVAPPNGTQFALCVVKVEGVNKWYAYVGSSPAWTLIGASAPADDAAYTVKATIDYSDATKWVKFEAKTTGDYATIGDGWYQLANNGTGTQYYSFVGEGTVASFKTSTYAITAEDVDLGGDMGVVAIPEATKNALDTLAATKSTTVAALMNGTASAAVPAVSGNTASLSDNIALGLVKEENGNLVAVDNGCFIVKRDVGAARDQNNIPLCFNATAPGQANPTVTYTLYGANEADFSDEAAIAGMIDVQASAIKIPLSSGKMYFRVKPTVSYTK